MREKKGGSTSPPRVQGFDRASYVSAQDANSIIIMIIEKQKIRQSQSGSIIKILNKQQFEILVTL